MMIVGSVDPVFRIVAHWGMIMAACPFWGAVASVVGGPMRTQRVVVSTQVKRRMREFYGEREMVSRRVRYLLRS